MADPSNTPDSSSQLQASEHKEPIDQLAPYLREAPSPQEGAEAPPMWLWMAIFGVVLFGVFYLGRFTGDFSQYPWLQSPEAVPAQAAATAPQVDGSQLYSARCATCHQANGQGVTGVFPPLDGTDWVTGDKGRLIRILLHGMVGEMEVKGEVYNGNMPAWSMLSDAEIAAVTTHERQSWGNDASEITAEEVAAVREATQGRSQPWTAEELNQPENQTVPVDDSASSADTTAAPATE
jgi:mono/diheme cytochrome c family protein